VSEIWPCSIVPWIGRRTCSPSDNPSLFDLAAALCFGIVKNHPFLDGNKRTGLLSAHALLFLNGQVFEPAEVDEVTMMVGVADGTVDEALLASWLARFSTRRA